LNKKSVAHTHNLEIISIDWIKIDVFREKSD